MAKAANGATEGLRKGGRPPVVLNVNDHEAARYMTTLMLKRAGFEVLEAGDGTTALALAERLPDVMVLDIRLPDIDGFEVCRRIRANPKTARIKILHTSATFVTLDKKIQGLEMGADGYLAQPFEVQELVATVQSLVRLSSAEHDLRDRADELVEEARRKDEFLAMLAHELRNPLSAISAALPLLAQREPVNEKEARARDIVDRQVRHLGKLVDDLLDVARVTRGRIELHPRSVDLTALLQRVVGAARDAKTNPRGQTLALDLPNTSLHVYGDPTRLEQVFANLIDNASKYTDSGGSIRLSVSKLSSGAEGRVRVLVRDTGIGISQDTLPTIFGLFSQAAVAIDRSRGGLGIGLTLARTLVELHGGRISAKSEGLGEGSQFEVDLPLMAIEQPRATPERPRDGRSASDPVSRRILLVEDNVDARQGLVDLWETWGHVVSTAGDGIEGVRRALAERPEIAFIDIGLPELDGYEVARRIRAEPGGDDFLLVALTGYGSPEQKARSLEAGFDHHLVKPVDPKRVQKLLEDLASAKAWSRRTGGTTE